MALGSPNVPGEAHYNSDGQLSEYRISTVHASPTTRSRPAAEELVVLTVRRGSVAFRVDPGGSESFWEAFESKRWEKETFRALNYYLRHGDALLIDVGAWLGPVTLYAGALGAQVIAYEPDPTAWNALELNVGLNPDMRITAHQLALGGCSRKAVLRSDEFGNSMASLSFEASEDRFETAVEVAGFDSVTDSWAGVPDLIKVDIEGGEFELAASLAKYLRRTPTTLLLSTHANFLYKHRRRDRERSGTASRFVLLILRWQLRLRKLALLWTFRQSRWWVWGRKRSWRARPEKAWVRRRGLLLVRHLSKLDNGVFLIESHHRVRDSLPR